MPNLLVIDDEPSVLELFRQAFEQQDVALDTAATAHAGLQAVRQQQPDAVILDVHVSDGSGLEVFEKIQEIDPRLPVIFMTSSGGSASAIEAMRLGALDYLVKPLDLSEIRKLIERAFEIRRLMNEPVDVNPPPEAEETRDALVGRCPAMQEVYKSIGRVASQNVTVLIRGESGTGKELVARALYQHSDRKTGPFLAVNCAAIPESLLESELFGHEKGAFTGADRQRIGKFEQCNGGTLFLDEIGDMTPSLQSKLLRVLQEQSFERIGGNQTIKTDVRVIAATNRDLEQMVANKEFRSDLYYRLNGYTISLPPLRKRGEDLPLLVEHFRQSANRDLRKDVRTVAPQVLEILGRYHWPGNVRELQSVVRQAILQTTGQVLLPDFLPEFIRGAAAKAPPAAAPDLKQALRALTDELLQTGSETLYDDLLARVERVVLVRVLNHVGGSQTEAARILGITRTTLRTKLKKLGITIDKFAQAQTDG